MSSTSSLRPPQRHRLRSPYWAGRWQGFVIPVTASAILLQLLFLAIMCYLYGVFFQVSSRAHALKVVAVDYDGAQIGHALQTAYSLLQADGFPTLEFHTLDEFPTLGRLEQAVCKGDYWASIHVHQGASARLLETINGTNTTVYQPTDAISYAYNGIAYPVVAGTLIDATMKALTATTAQILYSIAPEIQAAVNLSDPASSSAFITPIQPSSSVMAETSQGARVFFNTVSMVMPPLMQFFFIMALNGISTMSGVLSTLSKRDVYIFRLVVNKAFGLVAALGMVGYLWAFREGWGVSTGQFFQTWMCLWLFMDINYLVVDTFIEVLIPMKFWSFFMVSWIIINVASTISPFELAPDFYKWGHALPAHNIWTLLITIWSGGCRNRTKVALPVLFSWWVVGHFTSAWSVRKRCMMQESRPDDETADGDETLSGEQDVENTEDGHKDQEQKQEYEQKQQQGR